MTLVESYVRNPVKVTVGVLLVALFGVISLLQMPMQLTPEVQIPTLTVETTWPGASPQEVEQEIIREQEEQLKSVEGITKLSSESMDSKGSITIEFAVGANMDEALLRVNSRLQQVRSYPENADQPVISTSNSSNTPIAWFILTERAPTPEEIREFAGKHPELKAELEKVAGSHSSGLLMFRLKELARQQPVVAELLPSHEQVIQLRRFAEDFIEAQFERVPGVANSNVIGGLEDELQVIVDPEKLAARQLTIADVRAVLIGQNRDTSGGDFWESKRRWVVRTLGQFRSPEQVEAQLLTVRDGAPVYIRDVATVVKDFKKPDGLVRRFGDSSIAVNCLRETNANVLDVMEGLKATANVLNEGILRDRNLMLTQVYDETEYIYSSIKLVQENIFLGGALTMTVLMLFLHLNLRTLLFIPLILATGLAAVYVSPWYFAACLILIGVSGFWYARGSLVIGLAIPTSIIATFLVLALLGRTLNVISLAGLAFAVGMLVDNAVVVLENIYTKFNEGRSAFQATVEGTREVEGAIISSTLTTVAVFLPVVFVQQEAGQLFRDIALAISAAVSLSLVVALIVVPTAAARILPRRQPGERYAGVSLGQTSPVARLIEGIGGLFVSSVGAINKVIQSHLLFRLLTVGVFLGGCTVSTWLLWPAVEYLPTGNKNLIFGILLPPPGYNLDELTRMGEQVEQDLRPHWDFDPREMTPEELASKPRIRDLFFVARGRQVFLGVRSYDPMRAAELIDVVRGAGSKFPGTFAVAFQSSLFSQGLQAGRTIDIEITGPDLRKLIGFGGQILGQIPGLIPNSQVRPVPSLDLSSPEIHVEPRLVQAAEMGLTASALGYAVDALVDGAYASDYIEGSDKIDLMIRGRDEFARRTQDIRNLPIATPTGELVPLGAIADVEMSSGPEQINHRERERAITIQVTPPEGMPLESAMQLIQEKVIAPLSASGELRGGYRVNLAGTADKLRETWRAVQFNVLLALLITYLLMAALYESWLYPFVIILSVPLGAVGGLAGLQALSAYLMFMGQPPQLLDVLTMLGFVILIGTVVNNPILVVDYALQLMREQGASPRNAVVEAVRSRIRPMFMTTVTTVLGLMPLVLFPGAGSELYRGLGSVVLGGLVVSTVFTLFLIPTAFTLAVDAKLLVLRMLGRRASEVRVDQWAEDEESPDAKELIATR